MYKTFCIHLTSCASSYSFPIFVMKFNFQVLSILSFQNYSLTTKFMVSRIKPISAILCILLFGVAFVAIGQEVPPQPSEESEFGQASILPIN